MQLKLLRMGVAIPAITYDKLIERHPNPAFAAAAGSHTNRCAKGGRSYLREEQPDRMRADF